MKGGAMKRFYLIGLWAVLTMGWTACGSSPDEEPGKQPGEEQPGGEQPDEEDPDKEYTFVVSPDVLECRPEGETLNISVQSDAEWTAEMADMDWCAMDMVSGDGDAEVHVTVEANTSGVQREGVIRFRSLDKTEEVKVMQASIDLQVPMVFLPDGLGETDTGIGLFVVNRTAEGDGKLVSLTGNQVDNMEVTWKDGSWSFVRPAWWKDPDTAVNAYAYLPYRNVLPEDTPSAWKLSVGTDQSVAVPQCAYYGAVSDVLPGEEGILSVGMRPLNGCVSLQFTYDAQIYRLLGVSLEGGASEAMLDLNTGAVTPYTEGAEVVAYLQGEEGNKVASWILFSQSLSAGTVFRLEMKDLREGEDAPAMVREIRLGDDMELLAGKRLELACYVSATLEKLVLGEVRITDWEPGGDFTFPFN